MRSAVELVTSLLELCSVAGDTHMFPMMSSRLDYEIKKVYDDGWTRKAVARATALG